ncbi:pentapeptide repeat protein [Bifidobacterium psychraerophilum DSM 22366]|nr:pentapeptide repeat protein [Bifidobacterium psychraerophilum DSM 22366]
MGEDGWWRRWWIPVVVAGVVAAVLVVVAYLSGMKWFAAAASIGIPAFITVFIGVLNRNSSRDQSWEAREQSTRQARQAARVQRDRDLRSRSNELMSHQAAAIEHLGDHNHMVQAAGFNELIWLIREWTTLTADSIAAIREGENAGIENDVDNGVDGVVRRWVDHVQQLIDLAYKQLLHSDTEKLLLNSNARGEGLLKLSKQLTQLLNSEDNDSVQQTQWLVISSLDLIGAHLQGAHLTHVELTGVDMRGAHLMSADLKGVGLSESDLRGADLQSVDLRDARYNKYTTLPEGCDASNMIFINKEQEE